MTPHRYVEVDGQERRLPHRFTSRVVGVTFVDGYPMNLGELELALRRHELFGGPAAAVPATLVRNPANEHDPNAIEVHVDRAGMIGHLDKHTAAKLAPSLDRGDAWDAVVSEVIVSEEDPSHPAITVTVTNPETE